MTECTLSSIKFPAQKRRKTEAIFSSKPITSDGGLLLLQLADKKIGLLERAGQALLFLSYGRSAQRIL